LDPKLRERKIDTHVY